MESCRNTEGHHQNARMTVLSFWHLHSPHTIFWHVIHVNFLVVVKVPHFYYFSFFFSFFFCLPFMTLDISQSFYYCQTPFTLCSVEQDSGCLSKFKLSSKKKKNRDKRLHYNRHQGLVKMFAIHNNFTNELLAGFHWCSIHFYPNKNNFCINAQQSHHNCSPKCIDSCICVGVYLTDKKKKKQWKYSFQDHKNTDTKRCLSVKC